MLLSFSLSILLCACLQSSFALPLKQTFTDDTTSKHVASLLNAKAFYNTSLGSLQAVTAKSLPLLKNLSIQRIVLAPGSIREPHWYANANGLTYCIAGKILVSILDSGGDSSHFTIDSGQAFFVESGSLQTIENIGDETAELISSPRNELPVDFSLSASFGAFTDAVLGNTYTQSSKTWSVIPRTTAPKYIVKREGAPNVPETAGLPNTHKFDVEAQNPPLDFPFASAKLARTQFWPALKDISLYSLYITDEGMREVHWHPTTVEMGYVHRGEARMSVMDPDGSVDTYILKAGDVYIVPVAYPHQIEDIGEEEIHFIIFFDQATPGDVGFRASGTTLSEEVLGATLGVRGKTIPVFPFTPEDPLLVSRVNPVDPVKVDPDRAKLISQ
ncbi:MAG: hypothetical protein LQ351_000918 [Letrouitia transgressa]|nr:MAG: hypothetical protein LQ351_000918 [Letrouitia transgressa]